MLANAIMSSSSVCSLHFFAFIDLQIAQIVFIDLQIAHPHIFHLVPFVLFFQGNPYEMMPGCCVQAKGILMERLKQMFGQIFLICFLQNGQVYVPMSLLVVVV